MFSRLKLIPFLAAAICCSVPEIYAQVSSLPQHSAVSAVTDVEYYFDTDPGYGNGLPLTTTSANDITATPSIPIASLSRGAHQLFIRSRNAAGHWSMTHSQVFVIYSVVQALPVTAAGQAVAAAEYFIDTDPGPGKGATVALPGSGTDLTAANVAVDISGLSLGIHRVFFRTKSSDGIWSLATGSQFAILINTISSLPAHPAGRPVTAVEYFIDTDPGYGNGTIITVPATADLANRSVAVDITGLANGAHTLFIRSINGHSMTTAQAFTIGGTPLPLAWLNADVRHEGAAAIVSWNVSQTTGCIAYDVERSSDGRRFEAMGRIAATGGATTASYSFRDERPLPGQSYYRIRQQGPGGESQYSAVLNLRRNNAGMEIRINNPVGNTLAIRRLGEGAEQLDLSIRNLNGQEVVHPGTGPAVQSIDLSSIPAGMYLLCWRENGQPQALKLVKQ